MEFNCIIERESFLLIVKDTTLTICNQSIKYTFDISLKILITWIFREQELNGFILDDLIVEGDSLNMKKLKLFLGGKITYTGIQIFYCFNGEISFSDSKATKVCSLINRQTKLKFTCKCFKKSMLGMEKIHKEIEILKKTSKKDQPQKSMNAINQIIVCIQQWKIWKNYRIRHLWKKMLCYFSIVQFKQSQSSIRKILFTKAQKSHIMFSEDNKLKLVGFGKSSNANIQNNEFRLDIFKVGIIMHKFYQKQNFQDDQFTISEDGNSLLEALLNWKSNSPIELKELLCHPYFKLLKSEGLSLQIQCMSPKFKTHIFKMESLNQLIDNCFIHFTYISQI